MKVNEAFSKALLKELTRGNFTVKFPLGFAVIGKERFTLEDDISVEIADLVIELTACNVNLTNMSEYKKLIINQILTTNKVKHHPKRRGFIALYFAGR